MTRHEIERAKNATLIARLNQLDADDDGLGEECPEITMIERELEARREDEAYGDLTDYTESDLRAASEERHANLRQEY